MKYCIYLTTYSGKLMPSWYIGSTSKKNIEEGYHGTVLSKRYKTIWRQEFREHPELFKTDIIKTFETRKEALQNEYEYQVACDVVKSEDYINQAIAAPNGFFGMKCDGEKSHRFGKKHLATSKLKMQKSHIGLRQSIATKEKKRQKSLLFRHSEESKLKISISKLNRIYITNKKEDKLINKKDI